MPFFDRILHRPPTGNGPVGPAQGSGPGRNSNNKNLEAPRQMPLLGPGIDSATGGKVQTGATALMRAAEAGDVKAINALLKTRYDVNQLDYNGRTALSYAAKAGQRAALVQLIAHGADVNRQDDEGTTPLMLAVMSGNEVCVSILIDRRNGANVDLKDKKGNTALILAKGNEDLSTLLREAGAKE